MIGTTISHYKIVELRGVHMIGQTVSRYKILEKLGEGGPAPACLREFSLAGRRRNPQLERVAA